MNNLPNELMVKILQNLDRIDLDNSVDVCENWKDLIYDGVGVQRCVGAIRAHFIGVTRMPKLIELKEIREIGMNYCIVGDICDVIKLPDCRSVYLIKKMSFVGSIGEENFNKLTNPLNNLACLSFELKTLNNFKFASGLQFPNLKQFKLCGWNSYPIILKEDNLWSNFLKIYLESYFPQLQVLHLIQIHLLSPNDGRILVDALLVLLDKHKKTLRKFGLIISDMHQTIEVGNMIPVIPQIQMTEPFLQLHNFQIMSPQISRVRQEFNEILKTQTHLKVYLDVHVPFDPNFIQQNSSTLVTIDLHFILSTGVNALIDFDAFKNCTVLKNLTISGVGRIINAKSLPPSMESIRIMNLKMESKEASDLVTMKWTHVLKSLELRETGDQETFGISFDAILTLLKQKTIARVSINSGINKPSTEAAKLAWNDWTDLPKIGGHILERNRDSYGTIQFVLDVDNNYVFMEYGQQGGNLYIPQEPNQIYVDNLAFVCSGTNNILF